MTTTLSTRQSSPELPTAQFANITWLTTTLATGGDLSCLWSLRERQAAEIIGMGITCIIDGRVEADDSDFWQDKGVTYVHIPCNDIKGSHIPANAFDRAVVAARRAQRGGGRVLAHCHMGINRGPSLAAAILLDRGWAPIEAMKLIKARRPIAGIYYFMDAYDTHIKRNNVRPNLDLCRAVNAAWRALVRTPEAILHVQRAIDDHFDRDLDEYAARRAGIRAEHQRERELWEWIERSK